MSLVCYLACDRTYYQVYHIYIFCIVIHKLIFSNIAKFDYLHIIMLFLFKYIFSTNYSHTILNISTQLYYNIQLQYTSTPAYHLRRLTFTCPLLYLFRSSFLHHQPSFIPSSHASVSRLSLSLSLTSHSQYYTSRTTSQSLHLNLIYPTPIYCPSIPYCLIGVIKKQLHKTSQKLSWIYQILNINKIQNKRQSDTISIIEL